jgi:hypothetical protein
MPKASSLCGLLIIRIHQMIEKLENALEAYLHLLEVKYQEIRMLKEKGIFKIYSNRELEFIELVKHIENQTIFEQLISETYRFIYGHYFEKKKSIIDFSFSDMKSKVTNYFRKSGCYYNIYINEFVYSHSTIENYKAAFTRKEKKKYFLAPIEYVSFAENLMEFGQFKIQKFTVNELEKILNNKVNKLFYPRAYLKMEQLKELEEYWFIYFTKEYPVRGYKGNKWKIKSDQEVTHINIEYANLPIEIMPFVKILSLFDWQADSLKKSKRAIDSIETSAIKFKIPFVIETDDYLLKPPNDAPDLSILNIELKIYYNEISDEIGEYEEPERNINLNNGQTILFNTFINDIDTHYSSIQFNQNRWHFIELSLDFFIKGFIANGLEQLLWYVTSIEALLGGKDGGLEIPGRNGTQKSEGLTEKLARRISIILGKEEAHRKEIRKTFKELYDFRCNLVHGNTFEKKMLISHLITIRDLSRETILWFISNLKKIQDQIDTEETIEIPTREKILTNIDLKLIK